jgi:hypothetical protein
MAASVDTLDGFLREMKARFPDATARAAAAGNPEGRSVPDRLAAGDCRIEAGRRGEVARRTALIPSTDAFRHGNLRYQAFRGESVSMSKPVKTESELIAMARAELKVHADCPDGITIFVLRDGDSWEFRTEADEATIAKPGYPECVAMIVEIGDHLSKQYDVKG